MRALRAGMATAALVAIAATASAADDLARMSLEDLLNVEVTGASRHDQPLSETPSTATVITADDIRRFGFRDLGEALQMAPGVYTTHDRTYTYLGVRGFGRTGDYNSRILLLQDGARTNDPVYDQAMIGYEAPLEIDWVKRLEFVPGPSSALYGGNALFGIANAVLWTGADLDGTRVSFDAGSGRLARASILSGRLESNGLDWVAGLSVYGRRGDDLHFAEFEGPGADGVAHHLDGERYVKGLLKASWENWRGSLSYSWRSKDVPTAYFGTAFDTPGNFARDQSLQADLAHSRALAAGWDEEVRLHGGGYRYDADYPFAGAPTNRDVTRTVWWAAEYQLRYAGWRDHAWLFGAEVRRQPLLEQRNFDVAPGPDKLDDSHKGGGFGAFVQDEWRFAPHWLANLGARLDDQQGQPDMASPRVALIYRPTSAATAKLIYGKAFRPANDYERHYGDGITQKGNPDLKPERITTREVAVDVTPTPTLRLGIGRFSNTLHDLIGQVVDPADNLLVFRNQPGETQARGWETEAETLLTGGWRLRGNLVWQRVEQPGGGEPANSPHRVGKLFVDGPPAGGWSLGLSLQGLSARRTVADSVPGYVTANLTLRQTDMGPRGAWSVGLYNLAGKRYLDPAAPEDRQDALQSDGLQVRVRWEIGFR
ncbi:MAG: TonB-dependent receptor [Rhodocyclaceae bacterium]|nr:TonB-dependent receptor [Rhodocyclaceae bacterium]